MKNFNSETFVFDLKLEITYEFSGIALDIMKSYLTNRQQYTKIDNKLSTKQNINSGFRKVLRWNLYYSFYILTIYHQLHFFLRHFLRMTLFCLWLTKT